MKSEEMQSSLRVSSGRPPCSHDTDPWGSGAGRSERCPLAEGQPSHALDRISGEPGGSCRTIPSAVSGGAYLATQGRNSYARGWGEVSKRIYVPVRSGKALGRAFSVAGHWGSVACWRLRTAVCGSAQLSSGIIGQLSRARRIGQGCEVLSPHFGISACERGKFDALGSSCA